MSNLYLSPTIATARAELHECAEGCVILSPLFLFGRCLTIVIAHPIPSRPSVGAGNAGAAAAGLGAQMARGGPTAGRLGGAPERFHPYGR